MLPVRLRSFRGSGSAWASVKISESENFPFLPLLIVTLAGGILGGRCSCSIRRRGPSTPSFLAHAGGDAVVHIWRAAHTDSKAHVSLGPVTVVVIQFLLPSTAGTSEERSGS
jgi:hypothetical protein